MNRRAFIRSLAGGAAAVLGVGSLAKAVPPTPKPDFTFKGVPMWWQGSWDNKVKEISIQPLRKRRRHGFII